MRIFSLQDEKFEEMQMSLNASIIHVAKKIAAGEFEQGDITLKLKIGTVYISIHAPMKGATAFFSPFVRLIYTANHFFKSFVSFFLIFYELGLCFLCSDKNLM